MSEELTLLGEVTGRLLAGSEDAQFASAAWARLCEAGLPLLGVPEEAGGSGGGIPELAVVLHQVGYHAAAVPLLEHATAAWLLAAGGVEVPEGPLTLMVGPAEDGVSELSDVPWPSAASHVVVSSGPEPARLWLIDTVDAELRPGRMLAGEPRGEVVPRLLPEPVAVDTALWRRARYRLALLRSALIGGAAERVFELTVRHAAEREQFGKPINRFQSVQHHLAEVAGEVRLLHALNARAVATVASSEDECAPVVAAARVQSAEIATTTARIAHQVHGAIGFTTEHPLARYTRRLLAWRDEDGGGCAWERELGRVVLDAGPEAFWEWLTASPPAPSG